MNDIFELRYVGTPKGLLDYIGEQICEFCYGEGEVTTMESVWAGEPHYAPIGTQKCVCQLSEPDYDPDN